MVADVANAKIVVVLIEFPKVIRRNFVKLLNNGC